MPSHFRGWAIFAVSGVALIGMAGAASAQDAPPYPNRGFGATGDRVAPSSGPDAGTEPAPVSPLSETAPSNDGPADGQLDTRAGTPTSGASASVGSSAGGSGAIGLGGIGTGGEGPPAMNTR